VSRLQLASGGLQRTRRDAEMRVSGKEPARTLTTADRCHNCPARAVVETVLVQGVRCCGAPTASHFLRTR